MNWRDVTFIVAVILTLNAAHAWGRYEGRREAYKEVKRNLRYYVEGAMSGYLDAKQERVTIPAKLDQVQP